MKSREVQRSLRRDKRKLINALTGEADDTIERNDLRSVYYIVKEFACGWKPFDCPSKDVNGRPMTSS